MQEALVAILLAAYNGEQYIKQQIDSILKQTMPYFKLYIIDDASTDNTWEIIQEYAKNDPRIFPYRNERNMGVIKTFEILLSYVDTPFFCLSDQDDIWLPQKLEVSLSKLKKSSFDLVYSDLKLVNRDLKLIADSMWEYSHISPYVGNAVVPLIMKNCITGCTLMARSDLISWILPFPHGILMHDCWIGLVAASRNGIYPIFDTLVLYRQHGKNEIGATKPGFEGIKKRMAKNHLTFGDYLKYRINARKVLIEGVQRNKPLISLILLKQFYKLPGFLRVILSPFYFIYLLIFAWHLGIKYLLIDLVLTSFPFIDIRRIGDDAKKSK